MYNTEKALRKAIERKNFQIMYQPIVSFDDHSITLEALIRWRHKERWVSPTIFIPLVERLGLIEEMTLYVAEQAAQDWRKWKVLLPNLTSISINISPSILNQNRGEKFLYSLFNIFHSHKLEPHYFCLEITENILIGHSFATFFKKCKEVGLNVAIDDFGSGYSSLHYLARYPFDLIKIDKGLVRFLEVNHRHRIIIEAIIHLSKQLNLRVIAEGVETKTQLYLLKEMGVSAIQGYILSRPRFVDECAPSTFNQINELQK